MTVVISRSLRSSLGDSRANELAQEFYDYKVSQTLSFGGTFGRDKPFGAPAEARSRELWHVHLEDEASIASWNYLTAKFYEKSFTQDNYTSDTILVYGYAPRMPRSPYLLLNILAPDGHDQMKDDQRMKSLCYAYDAELRDYKANMPPSDWVIIR